MKKEIWIGGMTVDLDRLSKGFNVLLPFWVLFFAFLGYRFNFNFHFLTVILFFAAVVNFYFLFIQKRHTLLSNFGLMAQFRYFFESIGPELRQYLFLSDVEEKPFNRIERSEVYRKSKGVDDTFAFARNYFLINRNLSFAIHCFPSVEVSSSPFL